MQKNLYETGGQKIIPAVLVYVRRKNEVLLLHRNLKRAGDVHEGKWNGLGGKLEVGESPRDAAARELEEEAGIRLSPEMLSLAGTLYFPDFKSQKKEDWLVWVFQARVDGLPVVDRAWTSGPEGKLEWVATERVLDLPLWAGDRHFIPKVFSGEHFNGTIWYEGETVKRVEFI